MSRRRWLYGLLALLALGGGVALFFALFERVSVSVPLPPQGEARYNPLFALRQALRTDGVDARSYPSLNPTALDLAPGDTLVIYTQPEAISPAQATRLAAWVSAGGHLVMPGPGPGKTPGALADAFGLRAVADEEADAVEDSEDAIPAAANPCVTLADTPAATRPKAMPEARISRVGAGDADRPRRDTVRLCGVGFNSRLPGFVMHQGDSRRGYRFGRLAHGAGVVTVVSDLDFLGNDELRKPVAADLAYQVLAPHLHRGAMHLVYSADVPSLWRLLMVHGWRALLPALLALLAWLLWKGQRLGSQVPPPVENRRALLEHVHAAGELAFRRGRSLALHAAMLALFKRRLAVRDPALSALDGETLVAALAEKFSLPAERVRRALQPIGLQRPDAFLHSVSTLVLMRNRL